MKMGGLVVVLVAEKEGGIVVAVVTGVRWVYVRLPGGLVGRTETGKGLHRLPLSAGTLRMWID